MTAYYNENDAEKAAWLRELIRENVVAAGEVDERSIKEVWPEDPRGFTQCHFFAGVGVWSYALRLAGLFQLAMDDAAPTVFQRNPRFLNFRNMRYCLHCREPLTNPDGSPTYRKNFCSPACANADNREKKQLQRAKVPGKRCSKCGQVVCQALPPEGWPQYSRVPHVSIGKLKRTNNF